jgi:trimeric autotransporter adhesin
VITVAGYPFISACCYADNQNTFIGGAGNFTVTGGGDTGVGGGALFSLTTGYDNSGAGTYALAHTTTGAFNTAAGSYSLFRNTTGTENTAAGYSALYNNTSGVSNTAVGDQAMFANTTGVQITAVGERALQSNTTGNYGTAVGSDALAFNTTGGYNTATGFDALNENNSGSYNTAMGEAALFTSTTANWNTAVGGAALQFNTTGNNNAALGFDALTDNTDASANTAVGDGALFYNCAGAASSCTANDNTGVGFDAGISGNATTANKTGSFNTYIGANTGPGTTTQLNYAAAIGADALVSESNAMALGGVGEAAVKVGIGTATPGAALDVHSGDIIVGPIDAATLPYSGTDAVYINNDLGDANNTFRLDAYGNDLAIAGYSKGGAAAGTTISFRTGTTGGTETDRVRIASDGKVGVGTTAPATTLQVVGDIRVGNSGTNGCVQGFGGAAIAGTCSSDERLKRNVRPFEPLIDRLAQLQPVYFNWRTEEFPDYHFGRQANSGLIAQQVEKIFPEMVATDQRGYKMVNYSELPSLTLQGLRELKAQNDELREQVEESHVRIAKLEQSAGAKAVRLEALEARDQKLASQTEQMRKAQEQMALAVARMDSRLRGNDRAVKTRHPQPKTARAKVARVAHRPKNQANKELARVQL